MVLNWEKIYKDYPKAMNKLFNWLDTTEIKSEEGNDFSCFGQFLDSCEIAYEGFVWNYRNLYDFFDEQNLILTVENSFYELFTYRIMFIKNLDRENLSLMSDFDNYEMKENTQCDGVYFKTRKEAEKKAFESLFKILEDLC